jgi:uncharacterized protein involved in exopolysaccharide biosynthesis
MTDDEGIRTMTSGKDGPVPHVSVPPALPPGYLFPVPAPYAEDEVDLFELWRALTRRKWLIALITVVATAAATAYAFLATPVYRAEVVMASVSGEADSRTLAGMSQQFGGLASLVGIDLGGRDDEGAISIATLKSREFTIAFLRDNNLLPVLFERDWDPVAQRWNLDDPKEIPTEWDAFKLFDEKVRKVSQDKKTNLVTLSVEWRDRELAARWAGELVVRVNRHRQQEAIREAEKSIAYLNEQSRKTTVTELQQAIYRLIEAQTKKIMLANTREQYAFKVIDPAVAPDQDDIVRPKRPLVIALGFVGGGLLGVVAALVKAAAQRRRIEAATASPADPGA